jgi:hypothetical protein
MKRITFATLLFTAAALGLEAQSFDLRGKIPFDFQAGNKVMPAGTYRVQHSAPGLLMLREEGGAQAAVALLTQPTSRKAVSEKGSLEFTRYGEFYFLSQVWVPGTRDGRALPKSVREKEVARRIDAVQTAGIDLRQR